MGEIEKKSGLEVTCGEALPTAYSGEKEYSLLKENKVSTNITLPAQTAAGVESSGVATNVKLGYDCPVAVTFKTAIFSLSGVVYDDNDKVQMFHTSGYRQGHFSTIFGTDSEKGGTTAMDNLYNRAVRYTATKNYEQSYGQTYGWTEKRNDGSSADELTGLEWKDINFETGVIQIRRTSQYIPGRGVITDETKNYSSSRAIRASASVLSLLRSYRSWQLQQRLKIGDKWQEYDRLFTTWSGKPIHPDTLSGWFHNFIKNNGFTPIHIHSLRHTNATLLIAAGTNIPTVSSRLGHANPSTTTKIYTHAIQSADAAAAETLDDLLHPIKKKA